MSVNNCLKEIRTEKHIRQSDIAEAVGSNNRTISRIETGNCNPSLEMAVRIAHYLRMNVEDIFHVDDLTT